jgi:hypothetical protein
LIILGFVQENETYISILILLSFALLLVLLLLMNYKILKIAKTIKRNEIVPACASSNRVLRNKIKNTSTWLWDVYFYFLYQHLFSLDYQYPRCLRISVKTCIHHSISGKAVLLQLMQHLIA